VYRVRGYQLMPANEVFSEPGLIKYAIQFIPIIQKASCIKKTVFAPVIYENLIINYSIVQRYVSCLLKSHNLSTELCRERGFILTVSFPITNKNFVNQE
jgi:hypothetical protein